MWSCKSRLSKYKPRLNCFGRPTTNQLFSYDAEQLQDLGQAYIALETLLAKLPHNHPYISNQASRQETIRIHVHETFPSFIKSSSKESSKAQGESFFRLLVLYRLIKKFPTGDTK
jgi:hypothetical protein